MWWCFLLRVMRKCVHAYQHDMDKLAQKTLKEAALGMHGKKVGRK